jgi:hypothetical protein
MWLLIAGLVMAADPGSVAKLEKGTLGLVGNSDAGVFALLGNSDAGIFMRAETAGGDLSGLTVETTDAGIRVSDTVGRSVVLAGKPTEMRVVRSKTSLAIVNTTARTISVHHEAFDSARSGTCDATVCRVTDGFVTDTITHEMGHNLRGD